MKFKSKYILHRLILSFLGIVLLSAGCGGGGDNVNPSNTGPATLNIWKPFEDSGSFEPLLEAYRQKNPNVEVIYTKKNIDTYAFDLLNALASGQGPDIFSIHNDWLPQYLDKVSPAPEKVFSIKEFKNAFVDVVAENFVFDGKVYGTALTVDSLALYYNKDLLGSAGIATPAKTWAELASHTQRLKRTDGRGYFTRSGVALGTNGNINRAVDILYLFMLQNRTKDFSEDRLRAEFARSREQNGESYQPGKLALDFYTSFANPVSPNYNWNLRSDYSIDAFANGRSAYLLTYAYMRPTVLAKNPQLNFDVAPVPQPDLEATTVNFSNYWGEVVSKQSKNQAVAWGFLKFITSKENLDKYYAQNKLPASRKDLIEFQITDPEIGVFAHANLTAKSFYKPEQEKMDEIFGKLIDNIILNGFDSEVAINQAEEQASTLTREFQ